MENLYYNDKIQDVIVSKQRYITVALRGLVLFPGQSLHFDAVRDKSMLALKKAVEENQDVFFVTQRDAGVAAPMPKDLYRIGTVAKIKQVLKLPNNSIRVLVVGEKRMEISEFVHVSPYFEVEAIPLESDASDAQLLDALKRVAKEQFDSFRKLDKKLPGDMLAGINPVEDVEKFVYTVANFCYTTDTAKQKLLEMTDVYDQLKHVTEFFMKEGELIALQKKIAADVRQSIDKNQKEFYLREQVRAIKKELGEDENELDEFRTLADKKNLPDYVKEKLNKEIARMEKMNPTSPEAGVCRSYIEWILELPWSETTQDNNDLNEARRILDEDHYGLNKVKDRIVEFLAVHKLTSDYKTPILCFVGPPGVGKTSVVKSIARAAGKKFINMSLGGVRDEAEIRGHRRTYIGSLPGRIINGMKQAGVINPVFLLDEIDKMTSDFRGDPASALLEVLDPNQNFDFKDHYLEIPYDLSKVMFVATANTVDTIPPALLDRMELIELSGYTYREKTEIAKKYLLPKQTVANGLPENSVKITDEAIEEIIEGYTKESGVRNLEREIATVTRKIAVEIVNGSRKKSFTVKASELEKYLGVRKYTDDESNATDEVGLATGLAWTRVGGTTLNVEVALIPSEKSEIVITGSLGDVMKESCRAALSVVKSRAGSYGVKDEDFIKKEIHLHFPEGATPKDGPSAGITVTTALMSAFANRKVKGSVAMTGEITIRGKVLPIGGLKEKSLAAFRAGKKTLIIPKGNQKDIADIPDEVKEKLEIITVSDIDEVLEAVLV